MKRIIVTEEQLKYMVAESIFHTATIDESVMNDIGNGILKAGKIIGNVGRGTFNFTKDRIMRDLKSCKNLGDFIKILAWYSSVGYLTTVGIDTTIKRFFPNMPESVIQKIESEVKALENSQQGDADFNAEQEKLHQQKVKEVSELMRYVANLNGRLNLLKLSAENIVTQCEKYDYPLPLLLAQAHVESHFGTTPRAQRTNSVFSVGLYDNGKNRCIFKTQDESVEHYIKTMQNNYLNDKSVDDLLTYGNFVNTQGKRYASNKNYEKEVKATMNGLVKKFCPSCFN